MQRLRHLLVKAMQNRSARFAVRCLAISILSAAIAACSKDSAAVDDMNTAGIGGESVSVGSGGGPVASGGSSVASGGSPASSGGMGGTSMGGSAGSVGGNGGKMANPGGSGGIAGIGGQTPTTGTGVATLSPVGVILWDNIPAFPLGIYYNGKSRKPDQIDLDLKAIAGAKFNAIEASQVQSWTDFARAIETCKKLGLRVSAEIDVTSSATMAFVTKWKTHPSIWAWDVADDSHRRFTVDQVRSMNAQVKAWDPNHLTFQTVYDADDMGPFMLLTDMVWPYRYPVYNKAEGSDLGAVQYIMNNARAYKAPLVGIPQAYLWGDNANDRYPTAKEYHNMGWQYVIGGARALVPYSFTDSGLLPAVAPALWAAMANLNEELTTFADYFRLGTYIAPSTVDENVKAAFWQMGSSCLVAIENHRTFSSAFSFTIPAVCGGTTLAKADAEGVTLSSGKLSGTQESLRVRVFTIAP